MQIRPEFAISRLSFHSPDDFAIDNQCPDICSFGFFDKFLDDYPCMQPVERFNYGLGGFPVFG
jgi:hypothetical protein